MEFFLISYEAVFLHNQKVTTKMSISQEHKDLSRWNRKHFSYFKGLSVARNCFRPGSAPWTISVKGFIVDVSKDLKHSPVNIYETEKAIWSFIIWENDSRRYSLLVRRVSAISFVALMITISVIMPKSW